MSGLHLFAGHHGRRRSITATLLLCALLTVPPAAAFGSTGARAIVHSPGASVPASVPASAHWLWPLDPPHRILRGFEAPATRYTAGHRGIDIVAASAQRVYAPDAAIVHFSGTVVDRPVITLETADGVLISMEPVAGSVPVGAGVSAGESVGVVASGGHCSAACLHFGVRVHGRYVSPLLYLGGIQRAVLLPLS
jgi:murein DD-endopeptidase MepM/ murein hydrolase activator NlpD